MFRRRRAHEEQVNKSTESKRRFRTITNGEVIDLRLVLAMALAWPLSAVPGLVRFGAPDPADLLPLATGFLVGHGLFSVFLLLGKWTIWRTRYIKRHPALAFWYLFLATIFSGILAHVAIAAMNSNLMLDLDTIVIRFIIYTVIFSAMTQIKEFRTLIRQLEQRQLELSSLISEANSEVRTLQEFARQRLSDLTSAVRAQSKSEASVLVGFLKQMSEDVIRPISHELAIKHSDFEVPKVPRPRLRWQTVLNRAFSHRIIRPLPIAVLMAIFSLSYSVRVATGLPTDDSLPEAGPGLQVLVDTDSLLQFLGELATIFFSSLISALAVARLDKFECFRKLFPILAWRALFQLLLLTAISMALFAFVFVSFGLLPITNPTLSLVFLLSLPVLIIGFFATLVSAIEELRDSHIEELETANQRLLRELVSQNQRLLLARKDLSNSLHGPVRAALLSAALALNSGVESRETLVENLLAKLENPGLFEQPPAVHDGLGLVNETIELWRGSCNIELALSDGISERLGQSAPAANFLSQVLNESITNAITHGGAKNIAVEISVEEENLFVKVIDDGQLSEAPVPGLGSEMMNSLTLEWDIRVQDGKTIFAAVLPL